MVMKKRFLVMLFVSLFSGKMIFAAEGFPAALPKVVKVSRFQQIIDKLSKTDFGTAGRIMKFLLPLSIVGGMTSLEGYLHDYPILADGSKALCVIAILALFQDPNGPVAKNIGKDAAKIGIIFGVSLIANCKFVLSLLNKIPYDFGKFLLTKDEQDSLERDREAEIKSSVGFGSVARNVLPYFAIKTALKSIYGIDLD